MTMSVAIRIGIGAAVVLASVVYAVYKSYQRHCAAENEHIFNNNNFRSENTTTCTICLMDLLQGDSIATLPCRHRYHSECIKEVFEQSGNYKKCPICRYQVSQAYVRSHLEQNTGTQFRI